MVNRFKFTLMVAIVAAVLSCASIGSKTFQDAAVRNVGSDRPSILCAGFGLTDDPSQQFLNRSKPITVQQMHDHYSYLPCYVKGKVAKGGQTRQVCDFTIRAGGTVELACEDGEDYIYACDTCEELLWGRPKTVK